MRHALNTVPVNGFLTHYLSGTAGIVLDATGYTQEQVPISVQAALVSMGGTAVLTKARAMLGEADLAVDAQATQLQHAISIHTERAQIVLTAKHGIPRPWVPRTEFNVAADANQVIVEPQDNEIMVEKTNGTIMVEPVDRTIMVEKEVD